MSSATGSALSLLRQIEWYNHTKKLLFQMKQFFFGSLGNSNIKHLPLTLRATRRFIIGTNVKAPKIRHPFPVASAFLPN